MTSPTYLLSIYDRQHRKDHSGVHEVCGVINRPGYLSRLINLICFYKNLNLNVKNININQIYIIIRVTVHQVLIHNFLTHLNKTHRHRKMEELSLL